MAAYFKKLTSEKNSIRELDKAEFLLILRIF